MSRRKVSSTVYLEAWQHEALRELSKRTGRPVAYYVRCGIDLVLDQYGISAPKEDQEQEQ